MRRAFLCSGLVSAAQIAAGLGLFVFGCGMGTAPGLALGGGLVCLVLVVVLGEAQYCAGKYERLHDERRNLAELQAKMLLKGGEN